MNYSTYCMTCGAIDSYMSNSDNGGCRECGDTEGIITDEDYTEQQWEQITNGMTSEEIDEMGEYYGQ